LTTNTTGNVTTEHDMAMPQAPAFVRRIGGLTARLLGAGVPMGPNAAVTIRGRTSGKPRTTPLAVVDIDGRRWLIGAYGDVQWTRNLRAAGEATIRVGSREEHVRARELGQDEATAWFRDVLVPYTARQGVVWRRVGTAILRRFATDIVEDPAAAAAHRPVFELLPAMS
jgi:deazaflavin-dependent oxidoreductase (nitroreductase family)